MKLKLIYVVVFIFAFDSINHKLILPRHKNVGFEEHATSLIDTYLRYGILGVVWNEFLSEWITLKRGVIHGTISII